MRVKYPKKNSQQKTELNDTVESNGLSRKEFLAILSGGTATALGVTTLLGSNKDNSDKGYGQSSYGGTSRKNEKI